MALFTKGKEIGRVSAKLVSIFMISSLTSMSSSVQSKGKRLGRKRCPFAICSGSFERKEPKEPKPYLSVWNFINGYLSASFRSCSASWVSLLHYCLEALELTVHGDSCYAFFGYSPIMRFFRLEKRSATKVCFTLSRHFGFPISSWEELPSTSLERHAANPRCGSRPDSRPRLL